MNKLEQNTLLLDIAVQKGDIIYQDNKTLAKLSWLKPWEKNPRTADKKDLTKLEAQIEELGVYKPLIVYLEKDNATILGGNQRYKILKSLREKYSKKESNKYEYVWVSVVNADNDVDKIKYAISDNFSAGQYSRDKLKEILNVEQGNLFSNYQLEFNERQEIEDFISSMEKPENEIKLDAIAKQLKDAGIDDDIISDIRQMSTYGKQEIDTNYNPQKIVGCGAIQFKDRKIFVLKLVFGDKEEELYNTLLGRFKEAVEIFKEQDGDLYQKIISVYGKGQGDVLVKTLHLLKSLPSDEKFKEWKKEQSKKDKEEEIHNKSIEEHDFNGGALL